MIARAMVDIILSGVRTPLRPQTPDNSYLTEEDVFAQKNPQVRKSIIIHLLILNTL